MSYLYKKSSLKYAHDEASSVVVIVVITAEIYDLPAPNRLMYLLAGGYILCLYVFGRRFQVFPVGEREKLEIFVQFNALNLTAPLLFSHLKLVATFLHLSKLPIFPSDPVDVRHTCAVISLVHLDWVVLKVGLVARRYHERNLVFIAFHILTHILRKRSPHVHTLTPRATPVHVTALIEREQLHVVGHPDRGNPVVPMAAATNEICRFSREPVLVILLICGWDSDEDARAVIVVEEHDLVLLHDSQRWCAVGNG